MSIGRGHRIKCHAPIAPFQSYSSGIVRVIFSTIGKITHQKLSVLARKSFICLCAAPTSISQKHLTLSLWKSKRTSMDPGRIVSQASTIWATSMMEPGLWGEGRGVERGRGKVVPSAN